MAEPGGGWNLSFECELDPLSLRANWALAQLLHRFERRRLAARWGLTLLGVPLCAAASVRLGWPLSAGLCVMLSWLPVARVLSGFVVALAPREEGLTVNGSMRPAPRTQVRLTSTEAGLVLEAPTGATALDWARIASCRVDTAGRPVISLREGLAYCVPSDAFKAGDQAAAFARFVQRRLKG